MNKYHSFYLSDLENKIREVAMDSVLTPSLQTDDAAMKRNAIIAAYNDGVLTAADTIIAALRNEAEEGDKE